MKRVRPIHLHIDELVLAGFPAGDRHRIHDAVQRALEEMVRNGALVLQPASASRAIDATSPKIARLPHAATAGAIGAGIARSIVDGVGTAVAPERGGRS